jgi:hypothetical protein
MGGRAQVGTWLGLAAEERLQTSLAEVSRQTSVQTRLQRAAAAARGWRLRLARGVRRVLVSSSISAA